MFAYDSLALGRTRPIADWAVTAKNPKNAQFNRGCLTFGEVATHPSALFEASHAQEGRGGRDSQAAGPRPAARPASHPPPQAAVLICEISGWPVLVSQTQLRSTCSIPKRWWWGDFQVHVSAVPSARLREQNFMLSIWTDLNFWFYFFMLVFLLLNEWISALILSIPFGMYKLTELLTLLAPMKYRLKKCIQWNFFLHSELVFDTNVKQFQTINTDIYFWRYWRAKKACQ